MSTTKIEWTDKTWNPVTGCTKVSQGCKNCYAETFYERFNGKGSFKKVETHYNRLTQPMHWKKPTKIFVNSMSDLFHEDVPFGFIDAVFSVMADINRHTYQVLTKRPQRMLQFFSWKAKMFNVPYYASPNVWLGVSVENQQTADERIPLLLQVPASVRFLSCEPLLGPVDISFWLKKYGNPLYRNCDYPTTLEKFQWVICGGESGNKARPMHPDWARSLRDQCNATNVPFFFKQWGEYSPYNYKFPNKTIVVDDYVMSRTGKKESGRLLDGKEHNAFPVTENILA